MTSIVTRRRAWAVIAAWLLLTVVVVLADRATGGTFEDEFDLPGLQSTTGAQLLPQGDGPGAPVVLFAPDGLRTHRTAIEDALHEAAGSPGVARVGDPFADVAPTRLPALSEDGRTAIVTVGFEEQPADLPRADLERLAASFEPLDEAGVEVSYGGALGNRLEPEGAGRVPELIGLGVAVLVLVLGFGSLLGAAIPLLTALLAVGTGLSLLGLAALGVAFGEAAPTLATMIGLGVGIDYALFLTTRFRHRIACGDTPERARRATLATSGRAVVVAAATVAVALLGLYASGIAFIGRLGLATVVTVATSALAALTFTPAALTLAGRGVDRRRLGRLHTEPSDGGDRWFRYARGVARRPWRVVLGSTALLLALASPVLAMDLGHVDDGDDRLGSSTRTAYDRTSEAFGPGANARMTVVLDTASATTDPQRVATALVARLTATPGVAAATAFAPAGETLLTATVQPTTRPHDDVTAETLDRLVGEVLPEALDGTGIDGYVTGVAAVQIEFGELLVRRLPLIIATVVGTSVLVLLMAFRGIAVALKAAVMNLLSVGAAYGVLTAIFTFGWGSALFGLDQPVPIESYVPMMLFAILFGLSMDYEVFLLSRVRGAWRRTHDPTASIATGLAVTARVISCAALIMVSVFSGFVLHGQVAVRQLAVGLAVGVLIDATVVRLALVPATMAVLGEANWWLPRWLERVLPHLEADPEEEPTARAPTVQAPAARAAPSGVEDQGDRAVVDQ